jgi:flagellar motor switch protein FliM
MEPVLDPAQIGALRVKARRKTSAVHPPEEIPATTPFDPRQIEQPSLAQLRGLELLHRNCAQKISDALGTLLRVAVEVEFAAVEQTPGAAFGEKLPESAYLACLGLAPGATALLQMDLSLVFPILDRILGGSGQEATEARDLTEIEQELFEPVGRAIGQALREGWEPFVKMDWPWGGSLSKDQAAASLPPRDQLLLATFRLRLQETQGQLVLAFPSAVSAALLRRFAPREPAAKPSLPRDRSRLQEQLLGCRVDVQLLLRRSTVSIRQLCGLRPGDVLVLKVRADEPLPVHVAGREMFLASPVRCASQRGAQVRKVLSIVPQKKEVEERA